MSAIKYLEAWNQTMYTKTEEPLASLLHDSFHMHSPRHGESTPKEEHLKWCVNEGPDSIGDFKVLYEANGVMVGTHSATFGDEKLLVMYYGKEKNGKLTEWTINSGPLETS